MRNKFLIYMSVWLLASCVGCGQASTVHKSTFGKSVNEPFVTELERTYSAAASRSYNRFKNVNITTTTIKKPVVTTIKPKPVSTTSTSLPVQVLYGPVGYGNPHSWGNCPDAILSVQQASDCWIPLLQTKQWPVTLMFKILYCESKGFKSARNRSGATGLMQVLNGSTNAEKNIDQAWKKFKASGTDPWQSSRSCWA